MSIHMKLGGAVAGLLMFGGVAYADSISPETYSATLAVGESVTIKKTVTVSAGPVTTSTLDVMFLSDTTGSMGGVINTVKANASSLMAGLGGLGSVSFGAAEYKDIGDSFTWKVDAGIGSAASAQAGINMWGASGGGDLPEANLIALNAIGTSASAGWRAGAEKVVVWFGDAVGHAGGAYPSLATTIASLQAAGVTVIAVNSGNLDGTGQATAITSATGGTYYSSFNAATIVAQITAAIESSAATYTSVGLDASGAPAGVSVTTTGPHLGSWDRSVDRTFEFDVTFTGVTPGTYDFDINALVDRGIVATEKDHIVVGAPVPVPAALPLMLGALAMGGFVARRRRA